jgi:hypothetical protein
MNELKLPIEVPREFLTYVRHRYTKSPHLLLESVGKKKNPSLESGKTYWLPESYRLVKDSENKKLIQFFSDCYKKEKPKWIDATKMKKVYARYHLECVKIDEKKIKQMGKREAMSSGIPAENLYHPSDEYDIEDEFRRKPLELWRLKCVWDKYAKEGEKWVDNPDIFVYHVVVKRVQPEYRNFNDIHWTE